MSPPGRLTRNVVATGGSIQGPWQTARARTQGTVDLCVALAGVGGGIASGMILSATSYATLALGGGILAVAVIPLVTRHRTSGP